MKKVKVVVVVWLAAVAVGVIAVERWRRTGRRAVSDDGVGESIESNESAPAAEAEAPRPKLSAVVIAGAKRDCDRVRHALAGAAQWKRTPATNAATTPDGAPESSMVPAAHPNDDPSDTP